MSLALVVLASCASLRERTTPEQRLRGEIAGMPGVSAAATLVPIEADSAEAAWGRIVRARTEEPLEESQLLSRAFEATAQAPAEIVVGGPYPKLVEQVLVDAFALTRAWRLPGLRLVQVTAEPPSAKLIAICAQRGAACEHRRWRGEEE